MPKMIYTAVIVILMSVTAAFAQESKRTTPPQPIQRSPSEMAVNRVQLLSKQLKLSPEQEKSIQALYTNFFEQRQKSMYERQNYTNRPGSEDREKLRKQNDALQSETTNKVKELLDETQASKFEQILKEEATRNRGGGRG